MTTLLLTLGMMFANDGAPGSWIERHQLTGDPVRQILIAACLIIYMLRLQMTVWVFQKRKWTWLETILITVLMSFVIYAFARAGEHSRRAVGLVEVMGILIYCSGSYINTHSEYYRHL